MGHMTSIYGIGFKKKGTHGEKEQCSTAREITSKAPDYTVQFLWENLQVSRIYRSTLWLQVYCTILRTAQQACNPPIVE